MCPLRANQSTEYSQTGSASIPTYEPRRGPLLGTVPPPHTLHSTPIPARNTFHLRPQPEGARQLSFNHHFPKSREEELTAPGPPNELVRRVRGSAHPTRLTAAGEGSEPHTGSVSCAPSSRPRAGTCPPPPAGDKQPHPHGFRG
jgi:hypothetical protein